MKIQKTLDIVIDLIIDSWVLTPHPSEYDNPDLAVQFFIKQNILYKLDASKEDHLKLLASYKKEVNETTTQ